MRTILPYEENPALRETATTIPLRDIPSPYIQTLVHEMETLLSQERNGVALAAPQVGETVRLFIVSPRALSMDTEEQKNPTESQENVPLIYINPTILKVSRLKKKKHEGCLSVRGKWGTVPRAEKMTIQAYDNKGHKFTRGASGFLAHIFQHEMDHLNGILYIDKAIEIHDEEPENQ